MLKTRVPLLTALIFATTALLSACDGYGTPSSPPPSTWQPTYGASGRYEGSHYDGGVYNAGSMDRDVELSPR